MVLDGVVDPGAGAGHGSRHHLFQIPQLVIDPVQFARVDLVQPPEQIHPLAAQTKGILARFLQAFMDPHPAVTAQLFFVDVQPVGEGGPLMAQRLDQTGPSHSVVDGFQLIKVFKFQHAAMAGRG